MVQSQLEQSPPPQNEELLQSRETLERAMRLAEQAAALHVAREQARRVAQTAVDGRRSEAGTHPIGAQDEIALLKRELDETKDLGMRFAATAIRLGSEVNGLKSELKLTQDRILEARHHGDMADAQHQETQRQMTVLQAELARLQVELAGHHSSLTEAQQTSHALAEGWAEEVHNLREELHRLSAQLDEVQHLYQEAQGQMAALQSELATARALLAQTQSDSAHTEARLDTALATARTDAECARAELADVSQSAQRQIEALTMQLAEAEAFAHQEAERAAAELDEVRATAQREHDALQAQLAALHQEAQAALTRYNEQMTQNYAEIASLRDQLDTARQDATAQAESLQTALRQMEESAPRYAHEEMLIREELDRALQESARLRDKQHAVERDLERAHAALQEKDRALNDALLLVTLTETAAKASELELLRMHGPEREWRADSNAQRRR